MQGDILKVFTATYWSYPTEKEVTYLDKRSVVLKLSDDCSFSVL